MKDATDPTSWSCPVCLKRCNCSLCRKKVCFLFILCCSIIYQWNMELNGSCNGWYILDNIYSSMYSVIHCIISQWSMSTVFTYHDESFQLRMSNWSLWAKKRNTNLFVHVIIFNFGWFCSWTYCLGVGNIIHNVCTYVYSAR